MPRRNWVTTRTSSWSLLGLTGLACLLSARPAIADRISLRGGGTIDGVILPNEGEDDGEVEILTRTSARPFTFHKEQILSVERVDDALREYLTRRDGEGRPTGEDEFAFGQWAEKNGLFGLAKVHYRRAVDLDPDHAEAHKKIGHVEHDGRWITYDELREAQGLVKHKGKWISSQEKEELDAKAAFSEDQQSWARRLKVLRQAWLAGDAARSQQAEAQLAGIRDAAAVAPLVYTFGADPDAVRVRLSQILGAIPGEEATQALVRLILVESMPEVRQQILQQLQTRHDLDTEPMLIRALASKDPIVVGRAAWALGMLDVSTAVPKLIPVLVKVEQRMVVDQQPAPPALSATFTSMGTGPFLPPNAGGYAVSGGASGTVPGYVGGGTSIPILTGPVVGPGVVAFGATSVPFGTGVGLNNGGGVNPNRPAAMLETRVHRNQEVLDALRRLTGKDFGFDQAAWRRWVNVAFRAEERPARRLPQPGAGS